MPLRKVGGIAVDRTNSLFGTCFVVGGGIVLCMLLLISIGIHVVYYRVPPYPEFDTVECDPWKRRPIQADDYALYRTTSSECPEKYQSPSGCADFLRDPRGKMCDGIVAFTKAVPVRRYYTTPTASSDPSVVCFSTPLVNDATSATSVAFPPVAGQYRQEWADWGRYDFLPSTRYLHNLAHGGLVVFHHPCLNEKYQAFLIHFFLRLQEVALLQDGYVDPDWVDPHQVNETQLVMPSDKSTKSSLRLLVTPFPEGTVCGAFGIAAYGVIMCSNGFHAPDVVDFIQKHYRRAPRDGNEPGMYAAGLQQRWIVEN